MSVNLESSLQGGDPDVDSKSSTMGVWSLDISLSPCASWGTSQEVSEINLEGFNQKTPPLSMESAMAMTVLTKFLQPLWLPTSITGL